ncbi:MAG TPA: LytR C-terminal domain-containing protein [Thermoleophilaceae bacterium]|nr:LytR C-terminal domain-containing protein [Thermoleophilaceae bacterium]
MEILQEIGSYAGLAAVLGLAVLSALYFSQARDVKRLREWAGRAPERAPETTGVQRVAAKPVPRAPGQAAPTQAGTPAAPATGVRPLPPAPAGARAAAAGATPATAVGPGAATPAARAEAARTDDDQDEDTDTGGDNDNVLSQDTVVHPPPPPPGVPDDDDDEDFDDTGDHDQVSEEDDALDDDGDFDDTGDHDVPDPEEHWEDTDDHAPVAPRPATPAAGAASGGPIRPGAPVPAAGTPAPAASASGSGSGSILPPYAQSRPGGRAAEGGNGNGARRIFSSRGRGIAVVAAGILVLGGIALGATQLLGGDDEPASSGGGSPANAQNTTTSEDGKNTTRKRAPVNRSNVRVAVLNGTTVPGLAAQIGDQIERQGFRLGTVTNFNDQQRAESVVLYAPGAEREAAEVGRRLKIAQREPIDAESQGVAGDATVAVVTGQDKTQ